jgi:YXYXY domain-containing protein
VRHRSRSLKIAIAGGSLLVAILLLNAGLGVRGQYAAGHQPAGEAEHGSAPLAPLSPRLAPPGIAVRSACGAVAISSSNAILIPSGSVVTITATASGCPAPTYRFWELEPGRRWSMVQDFATANTFTAKPLATSGIFKFEVDARDASATSSYDATASRSYLVAGCHAATLQASPPSPHVRGASIELTAAASCPTTPAYRFLVRPPGGSWRTVQDYSASGQFSWTPRAAGTYSLEVDVRDQGATAAYEAVSDLTYTVG